MGIRFNNQALDEEFHERTFEAIKEHRRITAHKRMVQEAIEQIQAEQRPEPVKERCSRSSSSESEENENYPFILFFKWLAPPEREETAFKAHELYRILSIRSQKKSLLHE